MTRGLILVIDDNRDIRDFIGMALADEGYNFVAPAEGVSIDVITAYQPRLILADSYALEMWASNLTRSYRQQMASRPVLILMTTSPNPEQVKEEAEAEGYLCKPFSLTDLFATIEHFLPRR